MWDSVDNAGSYTVTAKPASGTAVVEEGVTATNFTFTDLSYETEYTLSVMAVPSDTGLYKNSDAAEADQVVVTGSAPVGGLVAYYLFSGAINKHGVPAEGNSYVPYSWEAPNALDSYDSSYPAKAAWKMTLGNVQDNGTGDMWFGANSGQKAKLTFGNSGYSEAAAIATALGVDADATYYGALICTTNFSNICKIEISSASDMGGGQATDMWVMQSTDNGATYTSIYHQNKPAKAGGTMFEVEITDPVASASYALVFYRSNGQFQYKAPQIKFYTK